MFTILQVLTFVNYQYNQQLLISIDIQIYCQTVHCVGLSVLFGCSDSQGQFTYNPRY